MENFSQIWEKFEKNLIDSSIPNVTCYHKMSVKSPVHIQRYSFLNMQQNNRKVKENLPKILVFEDQNKAVYLQVIHHFKAYFMKILNL